MIIIQMIAGMIACIGFAYLFNCPQKHILQSAFAGGLGWVAYYYSIAYGCSNIVATLIGTIVLSFVCEIFARTYKDAVTVFTIPAILPLVPGAGVYYTLLAIIENDLDLAILKGFDTLGCAMSIAVGIVMVSSIFRVIFIAKNK